MSVSRTARFGLIVHAPDTVMVLLERYARLAARHRLPALSVYRRFATHGGLMAYGADTRDIFRRSATYVDRILKGANPAEPPVQAPTSSSSRSTSRPRRAWSLWSRPRSWRSRTR